MTQSRYYFTISSNLEDPDRHTMIMRLLTNNVQQKRQFRFVLLCFGWVEIVKYNKMQGKESVLIIASSIVFMLNVQVPP